MTQISLKGLGIFIRDTVHDVSKKIVELEYEEDGRLEFKGQTEEEKEAEQSSTFDRRKRFLACYIQNFGDFVLGQIPANLIPSAVDEV